MTIGVLTEPSSEARVALLPEAVASLVKKGIQVLVQFGAGDRSYSSDEDYRKAGATLVSRKELIPGSDILLSIQIPTDIDYTLLRSKVLIGLFQPLYNATVMQQLAQNGVTCFSLDMLPRTTRAQSMDVLSSQANIAGYKAVLLAAVEYGRYMPMFMTAAGTIAPAKVLILGAGVAGLQAIATARRLGAVVEVFDTRPAVKEEVMSLGGKFIEVQGVADASSAGGYAVEQTEEFMERQKARIAESIAKADIVITTAQIQGKKAPVLVTEEMITHMRKGSVIIDLAAATGGNTEITEDNKIIEKHGVRIIGNSSLAATVPADASKLYGKNVLNFLQLITNNDGTVNLNFSDDLVQGCCICYDGKIIHERISSVALQPAV
ncbi:MAG TPA: Re/Si-specific NAD(P)(+) transhydrogenase subunit alpha [Flavitalea sp.]|nr:Re/Si-specific NAD(P)(+) transhydrogenase subunit alpha [Flavitalea sp.]